MTLTKDVKIPSEFLRIRQSNRDYMYNEILSFFSVRKKYMTDK